MDTRLSLNLTKLIAQLEDADREVRYSATVALAAIAPHLGRLLA